MGTEESNLLDHPDLTAIRDILKSESLSDEEKLERIAGYVQPLSPLAEEVKKHFLEPPDLWEIREIMKSEAISDGGKVAYIAEYMRPLSPLAEEVRKYLLTIYPDATKYDLVDIDIMIGKLRRKKVGRCSRYAIKLPEYFYKGYWIGNE